MYVQVRGIKGGHHMLYIGVDLGTSAVKLLLMDGAGHIEKIVSDLFPTSGLVGTESGGLVCADHGRIERTAF